MTLDQIALEAKTDKASDGHYYTRVYEKYLEPLRQSPLLIFEVGIGGYQFPDRGGQSLRMWERYFPNAKIVGIDVYQKDGMGSDRVHIEKGSQDDPDFLASLVNKYGSPDLIIDDASHVNSLTIRTFEILFPMLKDGGLYFCEDVHTSFWMQDYGGDPDPAVRNTTLAFFQLLTAQLSQDTLLPEYRREMLAGYLEFIHFYRNLVIVKKL
jgi:hypothetical protein